jgi:hypothetical protein
MLACVVKKETITRCLTEQIRFANRLLIPDRHITSMIEGQARPAEPQAHGLCATLSETSKYAREV